MNDDYNENTLPDDQLDAEQPGEGHAPESRAPETLVPPEIVDEVGHDGDHDDDDHGDEEHSSHGSCRTASHRAGCMNAARFLFVAMLMFVTAPYIAEQIVYRIARGQARAEAEIAREMLRTISKSESQQPGVTQLIAPMVVQSIAPSVVGIETVTENPVDLDEYPEYAERLEGRRRFTPHMPFKQGQGSGVVLRSDGYILTNNHVIRDAQQVYVILHDELSKREAQVVGADPVTDLAVLKIDEQGMIPAQWGDSDDLSVGEMVLAIGSPYGLSQSVTSGIISAKDRYAALDDGPSYQEFLQTDAPINPGNSGGPLVDMQGRVIGINTAIYGDTYQGIGFAIPSRLARRVAGQLREHQSATHGWLGVSMLPVTQELADENDMDTPAGAVVSAVIRRSPADEAGLLRGDIVLSWDGQPIRIPADLSHAVIETPVGSTSKVEVLRDGRPITIEITVGNRPGRY